jgi:hypothetical protein
MPYLRACGYNNMCGEGRGEERRGGEGRGGEGRGGRRGEGRGGEGRGEERGRADELFAVKGAMHSGCGGHTCDV